MHARLTATTVQAGSTVESLSELVLGSAVGLDSGRGSDSGDLVLGGPDLADDLDSAPHGPVSVLALDLVHHALELVAPVA